MTPDEIKTEISNRGFNLTMIADVLDKSPSMVSKVVSGNARSFIIANTIARMLGKSLSEVFPLTYSSNYSKTYSREEYRLKREELIALINDEVIDS